MAKKKAPPRALTRRDIGMLSVEKASTMLAQCEDLGDCRKIRDQAAALTAYARAQKASLEIVNSGTRIKIMAMVRIGELTAGMEKTKGRSWKSKERTSKRESLDAAGLTKQEASRCEEVARLPKRSLSAYIDQATKRGEAASVQAYRLHAKGAKTARQAAALRRKAPRLPRGPFSAIVVDPPWHYDERDAKANERVQMPYPPMHLDKIRKMKIEKLADDNSSLWLWTTNGHIMHAFEIMEAWGFEYKCLLTWVKDRMGMGAYLRGKTEHCLLGIRGKPVLVTGSHTTALEGKVRRHSQKPETFYELVEEMCPGAKVEIFSRSKRAGWVTHGDEV